MIVKIHKTPDARKIVSVCDSKLIGQKFEEGKLQLDLSSNFYKGEEKSKEEVIEILNDSYMINIVGEESVRLAITLSLVSEDHIVKIKGIPYAQAVLG